MALLVKSCNARRSSNSVEPTLQNATEPECLDCAYGSCRIEISGGVFRGAVFAGGVDEFYGPIAEAFMAVEEAVASETVPLVGQIRHHIVPPHDGSIY